MHSLSVANQTEQDTHKQREKIFHAVCMKLEIYAQTLTKYIDLQAECFSFTITGNESYLQFQQVTIIKCPYQLNT